MYRECSELYIAESKPVNLKYFQSFNPYTLGSINSLVISNLNAYVENGRIYDLLQIIKSKSRQNLILKCRCLKSKCSVKYCDCFSNGQSCGNLC